MFRNLSPDLLHEIEDALTDATLDDLLTLGEWASVIYSINSTALMSAYLRTAKHVNSSDVRTLDKFLFVTRWQRRKTPQFSEAYDQLLEAGIRRAIETRDSSLIESLILILEVDLVKYRDLYAIALSEATNNQRIGVVLYNKLRAIAPEVRKFAPSEMKLNLPLRGRKRKPNSGGPEKVE